MLPNFRRSTRRHFLRLCWSTQRIPSQKDVPRNRGCSLQVSAFQLSAWLILLCLNSLSPLDKWLKFCMQEVLCQVISWCNKNLCVCHGASHYKCTSLPSEDLTAWTRPLWCLSPWEILCEIVHLVNAKHLVINVPRQWWGETRNWFWYQRYHIVDTRINFHCAIVLNSCHSFNISSVLCLRVVFLTEVEKYRKEMNFE